MFKTKSEIITEGLCKSFQSTDCKMSEINRKKLLSKDFTLVLLGQIISLFGNGILRFALPLYLLQITGSAALYGLVSAISFIPMILLTPIGELIADRINKRNIMVALDFFTAALIVCFSLLFGRRI